MNEKEAREITTGLRWNSPNEGYQEHAFGYLECLEKAKALVKALKDIEIHSSPPFTGGKWHEYIFMVGKEALAKWEKER